MISSFKLTEEPGMARMARGPMEMPKMEQHYANSGRMSAPKDQKELEKIPPAISPSYAQLIQEFADAKGTDEVLEGDGKPMRRLTNAQFSNWGLTVQNTPSDTFSARTRVGIQNLVKWAKSHDKRVRVAGFRHTWGSVTSRKSGSWY